MINKQTIRLSVQLQRARQMAASGETSLASKSLDQILQDEDTRLKPEERSRVQRVLELINRKTQGQTRLKTSIPLTTSEINSAESSKEAHDPIRWPRISIVTPTYNQGQFIEETILSVINQRYPNLEYIIMDGGSNDATLEIIEKYRDRISIAVSEPDKGQSNAINKGMKLATGEILYWLNSDDLLEPNTLLHVGAIYADDAFDLLIGTCTCFDHDTQKLINRHIATVPFGLRAADITDIESTWLKGMYFHQPEVFFSKRIWEAAGGYVDEDLYYSMDYDLWARMALASADQARIRLSGKSFCLFRQHSNQKTSTTEAYLPELLSHSKTLRAKHLTSRTSGQFSGTKSFKTKLSIAAISDYGFNGGAGIAHKRVCQVLQSAGHDVVQLTGFNQWQPETEDLSISSFLDALRILNPDLVILGNLHNLKNGLEIAEFSARHYPTIVIAHDLWWVTGRCAYTHGCHYLYTNCTRACPTPHEYPRLDPLYIHIEHLRKKSLLQSPNLYVLTNSSYTHQIISQATLSWGIHSNPIGKVSLPITPEGEHDLVIPVDQHLEHTGVLKRKTEIRIVLGCTDHGDYRKGADLAALALRSVMQEDQRIEVDVYGRNCDLILDAIPGFSNRIFLHGFLASKDEYLNLLANADIFLGTSREETLGQTFVEAANAGLVTVGPLETGYVDVVNACHYSLGYPGFDDKAIAESLKRAIHILSTSDPVTLRALQESQAKALFSGMSFLRSFNNYLYQSGLWKRISYLAPTKLFDLDYFSSDVQELVLANKQPVYLASGSRPAIQDKARDMHEVNLSVDAIRLGPGLYRESVDGKSVVWLSQKSVLIIPGTLLRTVNSIMISCHWIPAELYGTECQLSICGYGTLASATPLSSNGNICFPIEPHDSQALQGLAIMLWSLSFGSSITLGDGRENLVLVCDGISLRGASSFPSDEPS